eukprot:gnl/TRDRNA2_/TRDRNA2_88326_c0_seq1.p1 gnl/TRDRNA2_/TRDRNA2_88326_c0~~gnl/TRDRNA2_/TRDRNA2_88326_c0_seq1.p1  ORF type:complete len:237 (-),score=11.46 gnl/TRDRNA2_/TRDRNA2_88326_c0_seq1:50-760(-)
MLLIGHFGHANWTADMFSATSLEVMNIFRDCAPRAESMIRYFTFKSRSWFKILDKSADAAVLHFLRVVRSNASACLNDMDCLGALFRKELLRHSMESYLCGSSCRLMSTSQFEGAMQQLTRTVANREGPGLAVYGITDLMAESLELLECAYPSYFSGAVSQLSREHTRVNPSGATSTPAMQEFANYLCKETFADRLYAHALSQFRARYALVNTSWKRCCRQLGSMFGVVVSMQTVR